MPFGTEIRRSADSLKVDLAVEDRLIVEIKAVERLHPVFMAQVITYLKLTGFPVGLLMNFNTEVLRAGLKVPGASRPLQTAERVAECPENNEFSGPPDLLLKQPRNLPDCRSLVG